MNLTVLFMKWKFPLFVGVLLSALYLHYFENRASVELEIEVGHRSWFTIYWAADGQEYSKWRQARVRIKPGQKYYHFYLTNLRRAAKLRVDPIDYQGKVKIDTIVIRQHGIHSIELRTQDGFSRLKPRFQIAQFAETENGLTIKSAGNDPQLELLLPPFSPRSLSYIWLLFVRIVAVFSVVFLFFLLTESFRKEVQFVPLFFAVAFTLIVVMAVITARNVHPDEYVHLDAAAYYQTNWLPPVVDDPSIHHTYSIYGVSRLNSYEVAYLFIGKFAELTSSLSLKEYVNLRMFNLLLFGGILLYILSSEGARLMAAPLLISPQLWYIFSYCNSDALSLTLSFLVACQVALPDSMLNAYLFGEKERSQWLILSWLGGVCALFFLMKKNYLFFVIFVFGYLLWRFVFQVEQEKKRLFVTRLIAIVLVGLSLASLRIGADYAVNGFDRSAKIAQMQEKLAKHAYKNSTPLAHKHSFLYRKARGDSLQKIIVVDRWFEKTYRSAFGMYGYFTAIASEAYYQAVRPIGVALFMLLSFAVVFRGGITGNVLLTFFLGCAGALIYASLYHSWTEDFQTQGRYLFPVIPMCCVMLYHFRHLMQGAVYKLLLTTIFLLSVYSFIFVALLQLPKIS